MPNPTVKRDRREYMRAYQRNWIAKRRANWIDSKGGCCTQCGSTERLEVDHIDPSTKLREPRDIWSRSGSERAVELAKCQVLCNRCHREKSNDQLRSSQHGTRGMYEQGCRCADCRARRASDQRKLRAKAA